MTCPSASRAHIILKMFRQRWLCRGSPRPPRSSKRISEPNRQRSAIRDIFRPRMTTRLDVMAICSPLAAKTKTCIRRCEARWVLHARSPYPLLWLAACGHGDVANGASPWRPIGDFSAPFSAFDGVASVSSRHPQPPPLPFGAVGIQKGVAGFQFPGRGLHSMPIHRRRPTLRIVQCAD